MNNVRSVLNASSFLTAGGRTGPCVSRSIAVRSRRSVVPDRAGRYGQRSLGSTKRAWSTALTVTVNQRRKPSTLMPISSATQRPKRLNRATGLYQRQFAGTAWRMAERAWEALEDESRDAMDVAVK